MNNLNISKPLFIVLIIFFSFLFLLTCVLVANFIFTEQNTDIYQLKECSYGEDSFVSGVTFADSDGINKCICNDGKVICTDLTVKRNSDNEPNDYDIARKKKEDNDDPNEKDAPTKPPSNPTNSERYVSVEGLSILETFELAEKIIGIEVYYPEVDGFSIVDESIKVSSNSIVAITLVNNNNQKVSFNFGYFGTGGTCKRQWKVKTHIGEINVCEEPNGEHIIAYLSKQILKNDGVYLITFTDFSDSEIEDFLNTIKEVK